MDQVQASDVEYFHDGTRMLGFYSAPVAAPGPRPGILVVHGAHGLGEHVMACARRIAALGYSAFAVDLWGDRTLLTDPSLIGPTLGRFAGDRQMWMGRLDAARAALCQQDGVDPGSIGAVGYCFGGSSVLEYARTGNGARVVVSLHGGLDLVSDDWAGEGARSQVLICTGADDPMAQPQDLARLQGAMSKAGIDWEISLYGNVRHAFTEPDRPDAPPFAAYDARADKRSWTALETFFAGIFAG